MFEDDLHFSTQYIYFSPQDYNTVNASTRKKHNGRSIEDINAIRPIGAASLLMEYLSEHKGVMPLAEVETKEGQVTSYNDGEATARDALIDTIRSNILASFARAPMTIMVSKVYFPEHATPAETAGYQFVVPQFSIDLKGADFLDKVQ